MDLYLCRLMKKNTFIYSALLFILLSSFSTENENKVLNTEPEISFSQYVHEFYTCINDKELNSEAFNIALNGYFTLLSQNELLNKKYLTIVDMSVSANEERFFVIDMETQNLVYKSLVAHGRNTGEEFATRFSNKNSSYQTSLGFYKTAETYDGKRGYSMKLDGLEYSNNNARDRGVVIHGANYVSEKFIKENIRLGRSLGCPSLPMDSFKGIVDDVKEGSCLFIYYPQKEYLLKSKLVNTKNTYLSLSLEKN